MENPKDLKYTESHEWARVEGDEVVIGITFHAQELLSDVVYVELPEVEDEMEKDETFATVESVKAASDCMSPLSGEIVAVNEELEDSPELVNKEPYGEGWLVRVKASDLSELDDLMDAAAYEKHCEEEEH